MAKPPKTEAELLRMPASAYMDARQLAFFEHRLLALKAETEVLVEEAKQFIGQNQRLSDELDRALHEEETQQRLRIAERQSRLLLKIGAALRRIQDGSYGFCCETGEPIGLKRLLFRPTAELCAEAKTRREQMERNFKDR